MTKEMAPYDPRALAPFLRKDLLQILFRNISAVDFAALSLLVHYVQETGQEKLYLKDLADHFQLPMDQVSKLARNLQFKGYVHWTHDDSGQEGTYLILDTEAMSPALAQKEYLADFFRSVVQSFGEERFLNLVSEAGELERILWQQAWKEGKPHDSAQP